MIELDAFGRPKNRLLLFVLFFGIPASVAALAFGGFEFFAVCGGNPPVAVPADQPFAAAQSAFWVGLTTGLLIGISPWFGAMTIDRPFLLLGYSLVLLVFVALLYSPFFIQWFDGLIFVGCFELPPLLFGVGFMVLVKRLSRVGPADRNGGNEAA